MANSPQHSPRPTLEDLIRFKRAERPAPEFWAEFDRGLRQKQLAALVKRPKGWARVRPVLLRGMRWAVPATAAAAVATVVVQIPFGTASKQPPVEVASRAVDPVASVGLPQVESREIASVAAETPVAVAERVVGSVATEADVLRYPVAVDGLASLVDTRHLPWADSSLASLPGSDLGFADTFAVQSSPRESRKPRTSWTSRFSELVHELGAEAMPTASLQFASLDLSTGGTPESAAFAPASSGNVMAGNSRLGRGADDRMMRELDRRFGVTGSSLSIKF